MLIPNNVCSGWHEVSEFRDRVWSESIKVASACFHIDTNQCHDHRGQQHTSASTGRGKASLCSTDCFRDKLTTRRRTLNSTLHPAILPPGLPSSFRGFKVLGQMQTCHKAKLLIKRRHSRSSPCVSSYRVHIAWHRGRAIFLAFGHLGTATGNLRPGQSRVCEIETINFSYAQDSVPRTSHALLQFSSTCMRCNSRLIYVRT